MTLAPKLRDRWAANIRAARVSSDLTQATFAQQIGVAQCTVSRWERAKLIPTEDHMIRVAQLTGQNARDMFPLI